MTMNSNNLKYFIKLKNRKDYLLHKYPIKSIALFGSVTRDDFNEETSDVDVLIELSGEMDWTYFELIEEIQNIFTPKEVDVVCKTAIPDHYWKFVEKDIQYV